MKRHVILSALAFGALLGPALAADLAPVAPPPPPCGWCGWYVGVNAGGNWAQDTTVQTTGSTIAANNFLGVISFVPESIVAGNLANSSLGSKQSGFIGGGQFGYNTQYYSWVGGFEADLQGLSNGRSTTSATSTSGVPGAGLETERFTSTTTVSKSLDYLGTIRARVGYLATPSVLVYGTAGMAYGGVHASTSISQVDNGIVSFGGGGFESAPSAGAGSTTGIRAGWTAGGGAEMQLSSRWSVKAEYLYYDLGTVRYGLSDLVATAPSFRVVGPFVLGTSWIAGASSTAHFNGSMARLGLNYKF
jgi:outer membrane immunogenic protein